MTRNRAAGGTARVGPGRMLARGLIRHCPRCGSGGLFDGILKMRRHCPRCGMCFEREEGFFLGAYVVNFGVAEGLVGLLLFVYILYAVANPGTSLIPTIVVGLPLSLVAPIAFYPNSKTLWAAIDLIARPLDPGEEAEAAAHGTGAWALDSAPDAPEAPDPGERGRRLG